MVDIGVELTIKCPAAEVERSMRVLDGSAVRRVWVPDSPGSQWELWTAATIAAMSTRRIGIGIGVTSPFQRSPAVIAHAAATLDHLSQGRISLSMGRGMRPFLKSIGLEGSDAGVAEGAELVRRLLAGETVSHQGEAFHFQDVRLPFGALQGRVPILLAAMSERWMEVASDWADGIHTYSTNERLLNTAQGWAARAAREGFRIVTTVAYIEPEDARQRWLQGMSYAQGLLSLMGITDAAAGAQELAECLTIRDGDDLAAKVEQLGRLGVSELMIGYRSPDELATLCDFVARL